MTLFLIWVVRILVLLLLIRIVLRLLFRPAPAAGRRQARQAKQAERLGGALVRDAQCGTYVPKARALTVGSGEGTQYFCSAACRDGFLAARPVSAGQTAHS